MWFLARNGKRAKRNALVRTTRVTQPASSLRLEKQTRYRARPLTHRLTEDKVLYRLIRQSNDVAKKEVFDKQPRYSNMVYIPWPVSII